LIELTMAVLKPFRGLRPPKELAPSIASPPYDVVSTEEARAYAKGNEKCFFHISRPEIGLPAGTDEHGDAVHQLGLQNLRRFEAEGWLRRDPQPLFYVYRQRMGEHVQAGLVAAASVEEYDQGLIKKHELTRPDKEDDRARHIETLGANDEPVFLTYRARADIDSAIAAVTSAAPQYEFTSDDGVAHQFWLVPAQLGEQIEVLFRAVPVLYIADGHHRTAAASRARKYLRELKRPIGGEERFLAVVFPHDQMQILAYNRVVADLHRHTPSQLLERVRAAFDVKPSAEKSAVRRHQFEMLLDGKWYQLTAKPGSFDDSPAASLDVAILQNNLFGPVLGIGDPRTDKRVSFVGGVRGIGELERLVSTGAYRVAFAMHPTSLDELMAIADAGQVMPPKSTWFEPKLRSGLVLHPFSF
jgi:uncharacterized protein (DUF1015 family)